MEAWQGEYSLQTRSTCSTMKYFVLPPISSAFLKILITPGKFASARNPLLSAYLCDREHGLLFAVLTSNVAM
jgi:hypothetical protein